MQNCTITKSPMTPREDAAVLLQEQFRRRAATLACGDASLAEDLIGEMNASVMTNPKPIATLGYYANGAVNDARDFRRKHYLRQDDGLKRRYTPGEGSAVCREQPDPSRCVRERTGRAKRKVGRPRNDGEVKEHFAMRISASVKHEFLKLADKRKITHEMLLRGGVALLLMQHGDAELARKFMDVGEQ